MSPRSLQQLAETRKARRAQTGVGERRNLSLSCNISSCIYFPSEHRAGVNGLAYIKTRLLGRNVGRHKEAAKGPFCHDIAREHRAEKAVAKAAGKAMIEERRLGSGECEAAEKWISRKGALAGGRLECLLPVKHGQAHFERFPAAAEAL